MTEFQKLTSFENLYLSYVKSMRGKGKKKSAMKFDELALENILLIKDQLEDRSYEVSPYSEFVVSEPKQRIIKSGSFRDKVLQHCLCDHVLLPKMSEEFIPDNYAGQLGKGTLFGLNSLSQKLYDFYDNYGSNGYILKCDITKFFYNINHEVLKSLVAEYFADEGIRWICNLFIDSTDGCGLPLGNQCSQVFALIYLNGLDHYITEELGCKYYGRYMDDFYLLSEDKEYLKDCLIKIKSYLQNLGLTLNGKTEIVPMKKGKRITKGFQNFAGLHKIHNAFPLHKSIQRLSPNPFFRQIFLICFRETTNKFRCVRAINSGKHGNLPHSRRVRFWPTLKKNIFPCSLI